MNLRIFSFYFTRFISEILSLKIISFEDTYLASKHSQIVIDVRVLFKFENKH